MAPAEDNTVLHALYKEASTRRHTADAKEAEVLALESACRDISKLTTETALLLNTRLKREIEQAFDNHQLPGTGFLTKAQLQAALHSLALLDSKPAAFSSSSLRPGTKLNTAVPSRQAPRQVRLVDSLWNLLTAPSTDARRTQVAATHRRSVSANATLHQMPADAHHHAVNTLQRPRGTAMLEHEAESIDSLLSQGLDLWQQLTGGMDADDAQDSQLVDLERAAVFSVPMADSSGLTRVSRAERHPLRQPVHVQKSGMHGVSLQQLLSFVQLVQQQSTVISPAGEALPAIGGLSQQQLAELNRLARMCSLNKQANMTYIGIGNRKLHQQPIRQAGTAMGTQPPWSGTQAHADVVGQQQGVEKVSWQPRGELADLSWPKAAAGQELTKQQPFARSASTAAEVVKRRQALAELEMVPCTFHPALDPHSLALVAAKAAPYKAPHRVGFPHNHAAHARRCADALHVEMGVSPAGSAADDPRQEAHASAELALPKTASMHDLGPGSMSQGRASLGHFVLTSWDMQEQQALKQCTFAPHLNANSKARSVVAQQWKHHEAGTSVSVDQHAADDCCSGLEEGSTAVHLTDQAHNSAAIGRAADAAAEGDKGVQPAETAEVQHQAALPQAKILFAQQQQSSARSKLGRTAKVRSRRQRQSKDSYVAVALKGRTHTAGAATASLHTLHPPQPQKANDNCQGTSEEQLQADVLACDRRLEQRQRSWCRHGKHTQQQHQQWSAAVKGCSAPTFVAGDTVEQTADGLQLSQAGLKLALEAVLPDGSASRYEIQQADRLRHLAKYFATMLEMEAVPFLVLLANDQLEFEVVPDVLEIMPEEKQVAN
ncbi:MAG: hypothetical protein FRX49_03147 [Trebouxia sp. A1-2]|nr:MAG: hypothetical protein FRX49_03147 [Trebouxia sp. A1-2]